jgi:hypothetical protein
MKTSAEQKLAVERANKQRNLPSTVSNALSGVSSLFTEQPAEIAGITPLPDGDVSMTGPHAHNTRPHPVRSKPAPPTPSPPVRMIVDRMGNIVPVPMPDSGFNPIISSTPISTSMEQDQNRESGSGVRTMVKAQGKNGPGILNAKAARTLPFTFCGKMISKPSVIVNVNFSLSKLKPTRTDIRSCIIRKNNLLVSDSSLMFSTDICINFHETKQFHENQEVLGPSFNWNKGQIRTRTTKSRKTFGLNWIQNGDKAKCMNCSSVHSACDERIEHYFDISRPELIVVGDSFNPTHLGLGDCSRTITVDSLGRFKDYVDAFCESIDVYNAPADGSCVLLCMQVPLLKREAHEFIGEFTVAQNEIYEHLKGLFPDRTYFVAPGHVPTCNEQLASKVGKVAELFLKEMPSDSSPNLLYRTLANCMGNFHQTNAIVEPGNETEITYFLEAMPWADSNEIRYAGSMAFRQAPCHDPSPNFAEVATIPKILEYFAEIGRILAKCKIVSPSLNSLVLGAARAGMLEQNDDLLKYISSYAMPSDSRLMIIGWSNAEHLATTLSKTNTWSQVVHIQPKTCGLNDECIDDIKTEIGKKGGFKGTAILQCLNRFTTIASEGKEKGAGRDPTTNKKHFLGNHSIASTEDFDAMCNWVGKLSDSLLENGLKSVIIPPHIKHLDVCCNSTDHFLNYDPIRHYRLTLAFQEYMAMSASFCPDGINSTVMSWRALLPEMYASGELLANDGAHIGEKVREKIAENIVRNRVALCSFDLPEIDLALPGLGTSKLTCTFGAFFNSIPEKFFPVMKVPDRLKFDPTENFKPSKSKLVLKNPRKNPRNKPYNARR